MVKCRLSAAILAAAILAGTASAGSCIISGYPPENPKSELASSAVPLASATDCGQSAASPLEARFRTWLEALLGTRFNSFKPVGTFFILR